LSVRAYDGDIESAEDAPRACDATPRLDTRLSGITRQEAARVLEILLEVTTEGIFGTDSQGCCVFVNDSAIAMLGYTAEWLRGTPILSLIQSAHDESRFIRADGSCFPVRLLCYPWDRGASGSGTICVFEDLTETMRLERELRETSRRHRALFEHANGAVYQTSREGELLAVNAALVEMLGFKTEQDLRAVDVKDLYVNPQDRREKVAQLERDGFLRDVTLTLRRKDGLVIRVLENARAVRGQDGRVVYYEGTLSRMEDES